jgi:hypothetical protein
MGGKDLFRWACAVVAMTVGGADGARAATLEFADRTWTIKQASSPVGPGPNRFSASPNDVWSDGQGLHLTIHKTGSFWYSTEVILNESHGYGTYMFQTTSRQDILDRNVTFGAFTWDSAGGDTIPNNPNREIDFEDGRWGNATDQKNSQVVVQPYNVPGNLQRLTLPDLSQDAALTRFFTWSPTKIEFYTLRGHYSPTNFPAESVIHHYTYIPNGTTKRIPTPGAENFRFNLWLFQSTAPASNSPVEVVVNDFAYLPLLPGDFNNDGEVEASDLTQWKGDFAQNRNSDANADGVSDGADLLIWQQHVGDMAGSVRSVPEPSSSALLGVYAGAWCGRQWRACRCQGSRRPLRLFGRSGCQRCGAD